MEGHTIEEAAILLKQSADFLRNKILFSGKPDPILKPCVFFPHPRSFRIVSVHGQANETSTESSPKQVSFDIGNGRRRNFSYNSVSIQGLFELTFFPDYFDMKESKESGYIQLYKEKAVFADYLAEFSIDMAVGWIMSGWKDFDDIHNRWHAMTASEASSTKSHIRSKVGDFVILSQNGVHYLVDSPASIPLSDIRITDKMLTEYAISKGITFQKDCSESSLESRPESVNLPQPEFISVQYASEILKVQVEHIKFYILKGYLNAYISGREAEPFGEMTNGLIETGDVFFSFKKPIEWVTNNGINPQYSSAVHFSKVSLKYTQVQELQNRGTTAAFESQSKEPINFDQWSEKVIKTIENKHMATDEGQLSQKEKCVDGSIESPEKDAARWRNEGVRKEIIAYELKQKYGDDLQWHQVARLADPNKKYTKNQEKAGNPRKTGQRWANAGKKLKEMTSS